MASALQGIEYKVQHKREEVHPAPLPPSSPQIIVIGALGVGKTSLLMRYIHGQFQDRLSRFVAEEKKSVVVDGKEVHLKIWDTAGRPLPHQAHPCTCPPPPPPRPGALPVHHQQVLWGHTRGGDSVRHSAGGDME